MKSIDVTCAIISHKNRILVVQRSDIMSLPLKWEFPGGKIEKDETAEDCIKREIKEELNIEIELLSCLSSSNYNYPNFSIKLIPFTANYIEGEIKLAEHKQYLFIEKEKLEGLNWAEADIPILKEFLRL